MNPEQFELPPGPPPGSFDVRFPLTQSSAAHFPEDAAGRLPVELLAPGTEIGLSWNFTSPVQSYLLQIESGGDRAVLRLSGQGSMNVPVHDGIARAILQREHEGSEIGSIPKLFDMHQNYPNPFNPSTVITYDLPFAASVRLAVFDLLGREVTELVNAEQAPGSRSVTWNAENMSSGVYYCRIEVVNAANPAQHYRQMIKMFLIR